MLFKKRNTRKNLTTIFLYEENEKKLLEKNTLKKIKKGKIKNSG